jgi:D-beta-D-heptose 7-phosphate kinase/D-beta-D-heptose 1-phosphate adenosyltransferase
VELEQILREIGRYRLYAPRDWAAYLASFEGADAMDLTPSALDGELAKRVREGSRPVDEALRLASHKIVTPAAIEAQRRATRVTLGIVSGCFDLLHLGHVKGIQYARDFVGRYPNGRLCVLALSDRHIREKKGDERPILNVNERLGMIVALRCVDHAILLDEPDCLAALQRLKPDWYFKSTLDLEQDVVRREVALVRALGGALVRFPASTVNIISTTEIIERMRDGLCAVKDG